MVHVPMNVADVQERHDITNSSPPVSSSRLNLAGGLTSLDENICLI